MTMTEAFVVFRKAILEETLEQQVAAMKRLPIVILAAGLEITKESIFPLLKNYISGGDDEVLLAIAANLDLKEAAIPCADVLGTTKDNNCWAEILEILELLCAIEETVVREQAVKSILHTVEFLTPAASSAVLVPLLSRLAKEEWFTARVSACSLLPASLKNTDGEETTTALIQMFPKFCEDETPMVRRAIARVIAEFAETAAGMKENGKATLLKDILPQFKILGVEDDSASVQHIIAGSTSRVAALLGSQEFSELLMEYVRWCAESPSWRIRSIIAPQFGNFCRVLGSQEKSALKLLPLYVGLLADPERDVRAEACRGCVEIHAGVGHAAFLDSVLPKLVKCIADESHVVRNAYAENCSQIILALDQSDSGASTVGESVTDLVVKTFSLLSDENPEVRAKVMSAIQRLTDRSADSPQNSLLDDRFLTELQTVAHDEDWRVRASFVGQLPVLARALGQTLWQKHFYQVFTTLITDQVAAVRTSTEDIIVALADELEETWLHKIFLPWLLAHMGKTASTRNSDQYILFLNFSRILSANDESERLTLKILPFVKEALDYRIPNVQFCACTVLATMAETIDPEIAITSIRPKVSDLADSKDADVSRSARLVMESFKWSIGGAAAKGSEAKEAKD